MKKGLVLSVLLLSVTLMIGGCEGCMSWMMPDVQSARTNTKMLELFEKQNQLLEQNNKLLERIAVATERDTLRKGH